MPTKTDTDWPRRPGPVGADEPANTVRPRGRRVVVLGIVAPPRRHRSSASAIASTTGAGANPYGRGVEIDAVRPEAVATDSRCR